MWLWLNMWHACCQLLPPHVETVVPPLPLIHWSSCSLACVGLPLFAEDADELASCEAHLTCARDAAKLGDGKIDERNISGAVCCHSVPIHSLFLSSPAHEHFGQHAATVAVARYSVLPELEVLLLDINCQFSKYLRRELPEFADGLRCYIGWLHAKAGHNLECQLDFNAMFGNGLGRLFGEGIEQLWVRGWMFMWLLLSGCIQTQCLP